MVSDPTNLRINQKVKMYGTKYESIKIPMLNKVEYPTWKMKMMMFLEAPDCDYLDKIHDGPFVPNKFAWTKEEKVEVLKDAKVINILQNYLYIVMSNKVITCKTTKDIWNALEIQCQGIKEIKKNRRSVLTQEYECFESKPNESLTEINDIF